MEMEQVKETSENPVFDSRGKFAKGNKAGAAGRPRGSVNKALLRCRETASRLLPKLEEMAEAGDMDAIRLIVSYGLPKQKPVTIAERIPGTPEEILKAMARGKVSPDMAKEALDAHLTACKIREVDELVAKVDELSRLVESLGGKA